MDRNTLIFSALVLVFFIYLIVELYIYLKRNLYIKKKRKKARLNLEKITLECASAKKKVLDEIAQEFDAEITQKIRDGLIWVGMSDLLLVASLGKAGEIKEYNYNNLPAEKWFYNGYKNLLGNTSYKREVIVKNKIVVEYSDR